MSNQNTAEDVNNKYQKVNADEAEEELNFYSEKAEEENLLDKYLDCLSFNFQQVKLILLMTLYLAGEGFVMIGISLIVPVISEPWNLSKFEKGFVGGSVFLGFTGGAALAGSISDTKGRRIAFCIGNLISLCGGFVGSFIAYDINWLLTSNFFIGLGIGVGVPSIFSLASELTDKNWRSIIIGGIWYSFVLGEIAGCYIAFNYEMYIYANSNWRILLILRCVTFFLSSFLIFIICESPKFLMSHGKSEEAFDTLKTLFGEDKYGSIFTTEIKQKIITQYKSYMTISNGQHGNCCSLFKKNFIKTSLILFFLWWTVSFVYYGFMYTLPTIYQKLHLETSKKDEIDKSVYDEIISDVILSCLFELPVNIFNGIFPIIIGRKNSILIGFILTVIFTLLCCFSLSTIPIYSAISKATIGISFNVLFTYTAEVYPTYMRTTGLGICNFFSRIGGFSTSFINEYLMNIDIIAPFLAFSISSFISIILTLFLHDSNKTVY